MQVSNQFVRNFDAGTRAGGSEDFESGLCHLERLAPKAVQFKIAAPAAAKSGALVVTSWSEPETLAVHCNCSSFQTYGEYCHHAWSALLAFERSSQPEIAEARTEIEGKKLKLSRLSEETSSTLMKEAVDLQASSQWPVRTLAPAAVAEFALQNGQFSFEHISYRYGSETIRSESQRKEFLDRENQCRIKRNLTAEKKLIGGFKGDFTLKKLQSKKLNASDLKTLIADSPALEFLVDGKPLFPLAVQTAHLQEREGQFVFSATFEGSGQSLSLTDVAGGSGEFIELKTGGLAFLSDDWSKRLEILTRGANRTKDGSFTFSRTSLPLFRSAFEGAAFLQIAPEAQHVFDTIAKLNTTGQAEPPKALKASLRHYQAEGLFWLLKMSESNFGGILADDMGLGKTVQIISYLLTRRNLKPCLVVVPKSLVSNWKNEIEKFGPALRVLDFAGANRVIFRPQFFDVVLTTYHVMKNEIDRLQQVDFDTVILDEAQAIKNPTSQVSKAVLQLKARQRFAMSGTPVENSLRDLFSLLNFTNPGLIPASFMNAYGDKKSLTIPKSVTDKIATTVKPFILRRTKKQVLTELPDKSEQVLICEMDPLQKHLYDKTRKYFRSQLKENAQETPTGPKTTRVFEALLRLRQIACHPALVGDDEAESAKVEMLLGHLEDIQASGHKALVFSQFTSFLDLLMPELKKAGIPFEHLDGQTRNRGAAVDRFNSNPDTTVFLISLKAGGTGLNLTTASYVFLMDPWWNPAIESQAIDRAYRMGQKQKVMAYRLIAKGSIEEKILKLQDQKRSLASALVSEDNTLGRALSLDDLEFLLDA